MNISNCSGVSSSGFTATSYLSDDADLIAVENAYVGMENDLQRQIDNIPSTYPGYDEYRYDLDEIRLICRFCQNREMGLLAACASWGLSCRAF